MSATVPLPSRIKGAIYGLATCDALGGPVEFKARGRFPKVTDMQPNDNFGLPPGCFTDDTSMALCLAHALLDHDGQSDTLEQVQNYLLWWQQGYQSSTGNCFDMGMSTQRALETWDSRLGGTKAGSRARKDAVEFIQKRITDYFSDENFCGNGSLMRVLPVSLVARSKAEAVDLAAASSLPTHPHLRCVHACSLYASLAYQALNGTAKDELATSLAEAISETPLESVLKERLQDYRVRGDWQAKSSDEIDSSGYVVDSIEAALWAFFNTGSFEDGAILAVNLGDDADTVGAIYGGIAGAFYGYDAIPARWLQDMKRKDLLDDVVQKLLVHREKAK